MSFFQCETVLFYIASQVFLSFCFFSLEFGKPVNGNASLLLLLKTMAFAEVFLKSQESLLHWTGLSLSAIFFQLLLLHSCGPQYQNREHNGVCPVLQHFCSLCPDMKARARSKQRGLKASWAYQQTKGR